jgi:hypothetical protein
MAKKNKDKKDKLNGIQKILAGIRQERYALEQKERDTQFECLHKRGNSMRLKETKTEGVFRCKECGAKLDFRFLMKQNDPKKVKAHLKEWKRDGLNYANLTKLQADFKPDSDELKKLVKAQRAIDWSARAFKVIMLKENKAFGKKGKKHGKHGKKYRSSMTITGGGSSILRR